MTQQEIIETLESNNKWMTAKDIAKAIEKTNSSVKRSLQSLRGFNMVRTYQGKDRSGPIYYRSKQ